MTLEEQVGRIADAIEMFTRRAFPRLPVPKPLTFKPVSERRLDNMDLLTYSAALPTVPDGTDVASQRLVVTVNGTAQPMQELAKDATTATFEVPQDASVDLAHTYVDDADNESKAATQSFVAKDTIPPDAPGAFGEIKLESERTVPDA